MTSWDDLTFFHTSIFTEIVDTLEKQTAEGVSILPAADDIMNAFKYVSFDEVKVVILGQDPYPDKTQAHGLAFSVPEGVHPYPASLKNIFRELKDDLGCAEPTSGCLIPWAEQGVLLLNTSLTVIEGDRNSHAKLGWQGLVAEVVRDLANERENLVFILWGKKAQSKAVYIDRKKHLVVRGSHPSPLAANKGGFFGTKPFSQANDYLVAHGIEPIDWCLP